MAMAHSVLLIRRGHGASKPPRRSAWKCLPGAFITFAARNMTPLREVAALSVGPLFPRLDWDASDDYDPLVYGEI
jgi:hypothetical protein